MKNLKFIFGMLVCTALFTACSSDDENGSGEPDPVPGDAFLSVEEAAVPLTYDAKDFLIDVSTNLKTLDVNIEMLNQADAMWFNAKYSAKNKQLKVSVKENRVKEERKATIKLSGQGVEEVLVTVTQAPSAVEHDPFEVEDFGTEWDNSWTVQHYMHGNKFDAQMWNNSNVSDNQPQPETSYWQRAMGQDISVALKLNQAFLDEFEGTKIAKLEILTRMGVNVKFALMTGGEAKANNEGEFAEYISETYSPTTTVWESQNAPVSEFGWAGIVIDDASCVIPASGNVFVVAKISGGGEWVNETGEFQWARQVLSRFAPTYVNFGNAEGKNLYQFVGGTARMNIHFAQQ